MLKLTREHKIAFARVITDLIEADFVVDVKEMHFFEKLISKEGIFITDAMLVEAKRMDFARALSILRDMDDATRALVVDILKKLSLSDGVCVPLESILIFAVEQVLRYDAQIYSVPSVNATFKDLMVVYIENEDNTIINDQIKNNISFIKGEFSNVGFDFIYIPQIVENFSSLDREYLERVVKYMIPSASKEKIVSICDELCTLSTSRFCWNLLYKKLSLNLIDSKPSLLFKISESDIISQYEEDDTERIRFSNFLRIELDDSVIEHIQHLLNDYFKKNNRLESGENKNNLSKFLYSGFHRSLFDMVAYGKKQKKCSLVCDMSGKKILVYFESIDEEKERFFVKLNPQETALFLMVVKKTLSGEGLDWRENMSSSCKKNILAEYNEIYRHIGKGNVVVEYKDRTQMYHIKNKLKSLQNISNIDMFIPEHFRSVTKSYYRIQANINLIHIIGKL